MPQHDGEAVELQQHREPDQRLRHQKGAAACDRHLPGRDRPRARALDPAVEVAIDDVVPGAARAAHREGADQEQDDVPEIDRLARGDGGKSGRPPARDEQQPRADRPVEAGEPQIGAGPAGREAVDPVAGRIGDATRVAHRASWLPDSVSKVPKPRLVRIVRDGRRRAECFAEARAGRPRALRGGVADLLGHLADVDVLRLHRLDRIRRNAAELGCLLEALIILTSAAMKALNSLQASVGRSLLFAGGLERLAGLLRLVSQTISSGRPRAAAAAARRSPAAAATRAMPGMPACRRTARSPVANDRRTNASTSGRARPTSWQCPLTPVS